MPGKTKANEPKPEPRRVSSDSTEAPPANSRYSAFTEIGFKPTIAALCEEIRELYLADSVPWIIGYSGGKDSTAVLQLIWMAILELPKDQRKKTIHVISTDTLVENPVVATWVSQSLSVMRKVAAEQEVPFRPHRRHRAERYYAKLSYQLKRLSTDQEIVGESQRSFAPSVTCLYLLAA